jgi:hypothetical protein
MYACEYWNCESVSTHDDGVCNVHAPQMEFGLLDVCPLCDSLKEVQFQTCGDCNLRDSYSQSRQFDPIKDRYKRDEEQPSAEDLLI